jgi:hypothetical protein
VQRYNFFFNLQEFSTKKLNFFSFFSFYVDYQYFVLFKK